MGVTVTLFTVAMTWTSLRIALTVEWIKEYGFIAQIPKQKRSKTGKWELSEIEDGSIKLEKPSDTDNIRDRIENKHGCSVLLIEKI